MSRCFLPIALVLMQAWAQAGGLPSKDYGCSDCHSIGAVTFPKCGPTFTEVAARYQGQKEEAMVFLPDNIKNGVSGKWGKRAKHPRLQISEKAARKKALWILSLPVEVNQPAVMPATAP